jgi:hypothetical protein
MICLKRRDECFLPRGAECPSTDTQIRKAPMNGVRARGITGIVHLAERQRGEGKSRRGCWYFSNVGLQ